MKKLMIVTVMFFVSFVAANAYGQISNVLAANIGGKTNGAIISKNALVAAAKISLNNTTKKVISFRMIYKKDNQNRELLSNSENLTPEMTAAINGLVAGTAVNFVKITCKSTDKGNKVTTEAVKDFTLKIQ
jgi:hypothetical protein